MARSGGADDDDAWRCMSCGDACDYEVLSQQAWGFFYKAGGVLWQPGGIVVLWDPSGASLGPIARDRFQRIATVVAAEAACEDRAKLESQWPGVHNKSRNLPIASNNAATQSKVALCVGAWGAVTAYSRDPCRAACRCGRCLPSAAQTLASQLARECANSRQPTKYVPGLDRSSWRSARA